MNEYRLTEVFTPTSPAIHNFVERGDVSNSLVDALQTPGTQIVVYGESGSGKSSLVKQKLVQVYEDHITTHCHSALSFQQLILDAFDQLGPYYTSKHSSSQADEKFAWLQAEYLGIKGSLQKKSSLKSESESQRMLPPQLTPQRLAQFLGQASMCWVLEDFHKIKSDERVYLSQALKVFCDMSATYPDFRVVAIGAVNSARQIVEYDREMRHRVCELCVELMSPDELRQVLWNGFDLLNIRATDSVVDDIALYSSGLASVTHQFGLNLCRAANIRVTITTRPKKNSGQNTQADITKKELDRARQRYLEEASDSLQVAFDNALALGSGQKYDNCRIILRVLSEGPVTGLTRREILSDIQEKDGYEHYPAGNLTKYLECLMRQEPDPIIYRSTQDRIRFVDPLHHVYAQARLRLKEKRPIASGSAFPEHSMAKALYDDLMQAASDLRLEYDPDYEDDVLGDGWESDDD